MRIERLGIPDIVRMTPRVFADDRGWFHECYNEAAVNEAVGYPISFVQDNHSCSAKGVLRGLHYQLPPHAQGKLIRVLRGAIFDVAVDIRRGSRTFGSWVSTELNDENWGQLWIPPGFAHGFLALADGTEVLYKTTDRWEKDCERSIVWNDRTLRVEWPAGSTPILSSKDAEAPTFADAQVFD